MTDATPTFRRELITHHKTRPALRTFGAPGYMLRQVRAIVIHWTANKARGANAMANRNYFNNGSIGPDGKARAASAHYIIDDRTVVQCLPENEVGFHCGDKPYKVYRPAGLQLISDAPRLTPNYFTIGIEMCVNEGGNWALTTEHTVALTAELLLKYGLNPYKALLRHFDVTGKPCPQPFLDLHHWNNFRQQVVYRTQLLDQLSAPAVVNADELNVRSGPGITHPVLYAINRHERVLVYGEQDGWQQIGIGRWVRSIYLSPIPMPASFPTA